MPEDEKKLSLPPPFKCKSLKDLTGKHSKSKLSKKDTDASSSFLSVTDEKSMSALYLSVLQKQTELEIEISTLQTKLGKCQQENSRLETERNRVLVLHKQQQEDLNEMQVQHEHDSEVIRSLKTDLDKLYLSFKNYREAKEKEIRSILREKDRLENTLAKFDCLTPPENTMDKISQKGSDDSSTTSEKRVDDSAYLKNRLKQISDITNELLHSFEHCAVNS